MKIMKIKDNQYVYNDHDKIVFQSYDSIICILNNHTEGAYKITLGRDWDYSKTTMKYLYIFLRKYAGMQNVNKKALEIAIRNKDIIFDENLA